MLSSICGKLMQNRTHFVRLVINQNKRHFVSAVDSNEDGINGSDKQHSSALDTSSPISSTYESIKTSLSTKSLTDLLNEATVAKEATEPENSQIHKLLHSRHSRPIKTSDKINPSDTTVILFPGQGSQFVGMAENLIDSPNVVHMFSIAKKILGYDLLHLCLNGPEEDLNKTQYCQPAVFVTSLAAVERLREKRNGEVEACVSSAGFSVGEITALVFAGALSFEDGLRLVKIRAEAMQYASELAPSGMITVLFNAAAKINFACNAAREWCIRKGVEEEYAVCSIANFLFPHCKVIAGHEEALNFLQLNAKDFGIKRIKRLQVSGAFHTRMMKPARDVVREALKHIRMEIPLIPVFSNYDATLYRDVESMKKKLSQQIVSPVKWEQILHEIYDRDRDMRCPKTYECGPGSSLLAILNNVNGPARNNATSVRV